MSSDQSIATGMSGRYARALFELALETDQLEQVESDLSLFDEMMSESEDLTRLVRSPVFSAEEQERALVAVLKKAGFTDVTQNFFRLVSKNRRLFAVRNIISDFDALLSNHRGEVTAKVATASKLDDEQLSVLEDVLKTAIGQDVRVEAEVDPALLGGLVVKVGSRMIDNSLRTKLDSLKNVMKEVG